LIESIPGANAADVVVVTVARTSLSRTFNSFWRLCFLENVTSELSSRLSFTLIDLILVSYSTTSFLFSSSAMTDTAELPSKQRLSTSVVAAEQRCLTNQLLLISEPRRRALVEQWCNATANQSEVRYNLKQ